MCGYRCFDQKLAKYAKYKYKRECISDVCVDKDWDYYSFQIKYGFIKIIGKYKEGDSTFSSKEAIYKIDKFECKEYLKNKNEYSSETEKCQKLKRIVDEINNNYSNLQSYKSSINPDELNEKVVSTDW